ncbi:hypothetical protein PMAYCL1PPCAC_13184, partial [Pristionchus mayeri]
GSISSSSCNYCTAMESAPFHQPPVGGPVEGDPSDPMHLEKVWRGMRVLNESSNDCDYHLIPIKVISAICQLVEGMLYTYEVLLGESESHRATIPALRDLQGEKRAEGGRTPICIQDRPMGETLAQFKGVHCREDPICCGE